MIEEKRLFNDNFKAPQDHRLNPKYDTTNGASFTYDGVTVNVKFTEDGKGLNALLINYFKSLN